MFLVIHFAHMQYPCICHAVFCLLQHKGHALLAFTSADALAAAADAVRSCTTWGADLSVGPAQKVPPHWPLELTSKPGCAKTSLVCTCVAHTCNNEKKKVEE